MDTSGEIEGKHQQRHASSFACSFLLVAFSKEEGMNGIQQVGKIAAVDARPDPRRWRVLFLISLFGCLMAFQAIMFAPIVDEVRDHFNWRSWQVNSIFLCYQVIYPVLVLISCLLFERIGLRGTVLIGAGLSAGAGVLRVCVTLWAPQYGLMLFIQLIAASSSLFCLSAPPIVAGLWFGAKERTTANALMALAMNGGIALGLLLPPCIVTSNSHEQRDFVELFGIFAITALLSFVLNFIGVPARPRGTNSVAIIHAVGSKQINLREIAASCMALCSPRHHFFPVLFAGSIGIGTAWAMSGLFTQMFSVFRISERQAGAMGFVNILGGSVCAVLIGVAVDRVRRYKVPLIASFATFEFATALLLFMFMLQAAVVPAGFVLFALMGVCQMAMTPLCFEFAVEVTFPVAESISGGLLMTGGSVVSSAVMVISSWILGDAPSRDQSANCFAFIAALNLFAGLFALISTEKLRRLESEGRQKH